MRRAACTALQSRRRQGRVGRRSATEPNGYAEAFGGRRTFLLRPDWLRTVKARGADLPHFASARKALFARADAALAGPDYSVVDKLKLPPSGDKHDYMSIGPYWWPDPSKPDGEPYVRRDGKVNPERDTNAFDTTALESMSASVEALTLAYYFSDDPRYAQRAAQLLRVWFLDPATRMNPNADVRARQFRAALPGAPKACSTRSGCCASSRASGCWLPSKALTKAEQAGPGTVVLRLRHLDVDQSHGNRRARGRLTTTGSGTTIS